jgi:hypothetical protein
MNVNGTNQVRLTNNLAIDREPAFSPDGSRIAFATERDGNIEIYYMNADGSSPTRITTNTIEDNRPSWGGGAGPVTKLKVENGNILIAAPGQGLILRSPSGTVCKSIGIDNAGAMTVQTVTCP